LIVSTLGQNVDTHPDKFKDAGTVYIIYNGQLSSCTAWSDVVLKYQDYVNGTQTWTDVINTYLNYVNNPC
jgi:hypothetical protein